MRISFRNGPSPDFVLNNEIEYGGGTLASFGAEKGVTLTDITLEIDAFSFCDMSKETFEYLQNWIIENSEIHMRAAVEKRDKKLKEDERVWRERTLEQREVDNKGKGNKIGFIYLLGAENGLHKIGRAKDLDSRIHTFGVKLPVKTWLVHSFKSDQYDKAETSLHEKYSEKRSHGEWFDLSVDDVNQICLIRDGQL